MPEMFFHRAVIVIIVLRYAVVEQTDSAADVRLITRVAGNFVNNVFAEAKLIFEGAIFLFTYTRIVLLSRESCA